MTEGVITFLGNGFGFIKIEGRLKDLFFHKQRLVGVNFDELKVNDRVTFDSIEDTHKGEAAVGVKLA